jgi:hypothetical protein
MPDLPKARPALICLQCRYVGPAPRARTHPAVHPGTSQTPRQFVALSPTCQEPSPRRRCYGRPQQRTAVLAQANGGAAHQAHIRLSACPKMTRSLLLSCLPTDEQRQEFIDAFAEVGIDVEVGDGKAAGFFIEVWTAYVAIRALDVFIDRWVSDAADMLKQLAKGIFHAMRSSGKHGAVDLKIRGDR